jgi:hypothetical protein
MNSSSLPPEQESMIAEALEIAKLLEQKSQLMSERATVIADKYYKHRHDTAIATQQNLGNS